MKLTIFSLPIFLALATGFGASAKAETSKESTIRAAIDQELAHFIASFKKQDPAAMAELYAPDVVIVESKAPVRHGRHSVETMWQENKKDWGPGTWIDCALQRGGLTIHGDTAVEYGRSIFTFQKKGQAPKKLEGQYLTLWQKQPDGSWKVQAESWPD